MLLEGESGSSRELLLSYRKQERTARWTSGCNRAAGLLFLGSHGVFVLVVSISLGSLSEASWWLLFVPVWAGDAVCSVLVIISWFASCPYIKLCLVERQQRLGSENPSILTDILPDIVLAAVGLIFLLLIFFGEYALCAYLDSAQHGEPRALLAVVVLLVIVSMLAICRGICLTRNSAHFISVGAGLLVAVSAFAATRGEDVAPSSQALAALPAAACAACFLALSALRLSTIMRVLSWEESLLRGAEILMLAALVFATGLFTLNVWRSKLAEAGIDGATAGVSMCVIVVLRWRMFCLELRRRPMDERLLMESLSDPALPPRSDSEVQLRESVQLAA